MSDIGHCRTYYINSAQRDTGTASNFTFNLDTLPNDHFTHACVLQAKIPLSFYLVRPGINTFKLIEDGLSVTITIPEGNYNYVSFSDTLVPLLNTNSPRSWKYDMTLNKTTAKFTFTVTDNIGNAQPQFQFFNWLYEQFGFDKNQTFTFEANKLVSKNVVSFVPETTLYIHSSLVGDGINQGVLQEIYANDDIPFSVVTYQLTTDPKAYSKRIRDVNVLNASFNIQDEDDNLIDTNGQAVQITLLLYREDNFKDIFKTYVKYVVSKESDDTQPQL